MMCLAIARPSTVRLLAAATLFAVSLGTAHADGVAAEAEHPRPATAHKKKRTAHARFSGRLASASELRDEPLDKPSGHLELYAVNFRENLEVDLYDEDGNLDQEAIDQLNHLWRCKRTDTEKAISPRLYEMLSRVWDRFGKRIELVSGFRNQKRTSSFHFHGSASDIRIPGAAQVRHVARRGRHGHRHLSARRIRAHRRPSRAVVPLDRLQRTGPGIGPPHEVEEQEGPEHVIDRLWTRR